MAFLFRCVDYMLGQIRISSENTSRVANCGKYAGMQVLGAVMSSRRNKRCVTTLKSLLSLISQ